MVDTRPTKERENHSHRIDKHHVTYLPNMDDDYWISRLQINGGDAFRWMTRFDEANRQSYIGFEV